MIIFIDHDTWPAKALKIHFSLAAPLKKIDTLFICVLNIYFSVLEYKNIHAYIKSSS